MAVIAAAIINPLNVTSATDKVSQDIFFRYIAPLYSDERAPAADDGPSQKGARQRTPGDQARQSPITVIILDDHFVQTIRSSWPVSHRTLTKFLQILRCYAPKAIFFDLLFTHEHSSAGQTELFIANLKGDEAYQGRSTADGDTLPYVQDAKAYATDGAALETKIVDRCAKSMLDADALGSEAYQEAFDALRSAMLPLAPAYIGDLAPQKNYPVEGGSAVFETLREAGVDRLPTNWVADDGAYPLLITLDAEATLPPAADDGTPEDEQAAARASAAEEIWQEAWPGSVEGKLPSAALALYAHLDDDMSLAEHMSALEGDRILAHLVREQREKMIVEWGFYPRHLPKEAMTDEEFARPDAFLRLRRLPEGCTTRPARNVTTWWKTWWDQENSWSSPPPPPPPQLESVWQFLLDTIGLLNPNPDQPRQACPYNQWVPGEAVLAARSPAQQQTLRDLFQDRVVMIGADIKGAPDLVQSPVHGQIPGVFLHAMALDNLWKNGMGGYWRPMPKPPKADYIPSFISDMSLGKGIESLLVWMMLGFSAYVAGLRKRLGKRWSELAYMSLELTGNALLILVVVAGFTLLAIAPMNWLGLVTVAASKGMLEHLKLPKVERGRIMWLRSKFTP